MTTWAVRIVEQQAEDLKRPPMSVAELVDVMEKQGLAVTATKLRSLPPVGETTYTIDVVSSVLGVPNRTLISKARTIERRRGTQAPVPFGCS